MQRRLGSTIQRIGAKEGAFPYADVSGIPELDVRTLMPVFDEPLNRGLNCSCDDHVKSLSVAPEHE